MELTRIAAAVVVNGAAYLVDMGAGVVRRAKSAAVDKGVAALEPVNLRVVFVTHLHSDHTVGVDHFTSDQRLAVPHAAAAGDDFGRIHGSRA